MKYGTWESYSGNAAFTLAASLLVIAITFAYLGTRLHRRLAVEAPGKFVGAAILLIWLLSGFSFLTAALTYVQALTVQVGKFTQPQNPINPITTLSGLITFVVIIIRSEKNGIKSELISGRVGTIAGFMGYELSFEVIVFGRTYPPSPAEE